MAERQSHLLTSEIAEITLAVNDMPLAEQRAKDLEKQAASERLNAKLRRKHAFAAASTRLMWLIKSGSIIPSEIVREVAELNDIDPLHMRHTKEPQADATIAAYDSLQPETPFIGLYDRDARQSITGIVVDIPTDIKVHPYVPQKEGSIVMETKMTPWAEVTLPVRTLRGEEEVELSVTTELSTLRRVIIGRQAIKNLADTAKFETRPDPSTCHPGGPIPNTGELASLKHDIEELHRLGMETVDMSGIEKALTRSQEHAAFRRQLSRSSQTAYNQRNRRYKRAR